MGGVIEATLHPSSDVDREIRVRMERKQALSKPNPPDFWMIVTEGALLQQVGTSKVMAEQIDHLIELAQEPNVTLQVLPFEVGAHAALEIGNFTLLTLDELTVLVTVTDNTSIFWDDQEANGRHTEVFELLPADGWRPTQTADFLNRTVKALEKEQRWIYLA